MPVTYIYILLEINKYLINNIVVGIRFSSIVVNKISLNKVSVFCKIYILYRGDKTYDYNITKLNFPFISYYYILNNT